MITKLTFQSGDHAVLLETVEDLRDLVDARAVSVREMAMGTVRVF